MVDIGCLPNFFILGAAKAGTTSLFNVLSEHPLIFGSPVKEPGFFNHDERYAQGFSWYQETYFKNAHNFPVRMEATPAYLTWSEKTSQRLNEEYPLKSIKFTVIFRDPVERAYSHYWHRVRLGHETLSFEEALQAEPARIEENYDELYRTGDGRYGYFRAGCYASRLQPFLERFNKKDFHFMLQEDLAKDRFRTKGADLQEFLEVEPVEGLTATHANPATLASDRKAARFYWKLKRTYLSRVYRSLVGRGLRSRIYSMIFPPASYPEIDPATAEKLRQRYADEVKKLEQIINRDLSAWLEPTPKQPSA